MLTLRSQAFVLSRSPLTESSWIVSLLTREDGKARVVAKGARRTKSPFRGALEPLNLVRVELSRREGRDLDTLVLADLETSALALFGKWPGAGILLAIAETLDRGLPEHSAEEETFRLVGSVLDAIRGGAAPDLAWAYFGTWFLRLHGVLGRPNRCASCGQAPPASWFDPAAGGWLCSDCSRHRTRDAVAFSPQTRDLLDGVFKKPLSDLAEEPVPPEALRGLKSVVYCALTAYLGRPLASASAVAG